MGLIDYLGLASVNLTWKAVSDYPVLMLELRNAAKVYTSSANANVVGLVNVNLRFASTGLVFIIGPSGSGKTTLLNLMTGADRASGGGVFVNGINIREFGAKGLAGYRNSYVGFVPQDFSHIENLTLAENVRLAFDARGKKADDAEIDQIFEGLGIGGLQGRYPSEVSGGQLQRMAIARALVTKPKILFTDELTSNLDSAQRDEIYKTLKQLSKDILVIATTHSREMVDIYADRIITINGGRVTSDVYASDDKTNLEIFGKDEVIIIEPDATLNSADLDKLNTVITGRRAKKNSDGGVFFCVVTRDQIEKHYPKAAKQLIERTMARKNKRKQEDKERKKLKTEIADSAGSFSYEKTGISIKKAGGLAWRGFVKNRARAVLGVLLCIFAITLFAVFLNLGTVTHNRTIVHSFRGSDANYLRLHDRGAVLTQQDRRDWTNQNHRHTAMSYEIGGEVFGIRSLAVLDDVPNHDARYNMFGQRLLEGRWPRLAPPGTTIINEAVISDFTARQIRISYDDDEMDLIDYTISFNNGRLTFTIVGIYQTNYRDFFTEDLTLRVGQSTVNRHRVIHHVEHDFATAFVASDVIDQIRGGGRGVFAWDSTTTNEIIIGGGPISTDSDGFGDDGAGGFYLTDLVNGQMPTVSQFPLTPFFRTLYVEGNDLSVRRGSPTQFNTIVSRGLFEAMGRISTYNFNVTRRVTEGQAFVIDGNRVVPRADTMAIPFNHTPEAFSFSLGIDPANLIDSDDLIMVLPEYDYARFVDHMVIPATSILLSRHLSDRQLIQTLGASSASAIYKDSYLLDGFSRGFETTAAILFVVAIAVGLFTIFLLYMFLGTGNDRRRKMASVLVTLGARNGDILRINLLEALIFSGFVLVGSWIFSWLAIGLGNVIARGSAGVWVRPLVTTPSFFLTILAGAFLVIIACTMVQTIMILKKR